MEKGRYQKLKLLYLLEILRDYSDENTYLSVKELTSLLLKKEIVVERKTLYKDIELLQDYGFNIVVEKNGRENTYALVEREFELAEVKMLIDVIQASKFLTAKKSRDLILKLKKLASQNKHKKYKDRYILSKKINILMKIFIIMSMRFTMQLLKISKLILIIGNGIIRSR